MHENFSNRVRIQAGRLTAGLHRRLIARVIGGMLIALAPIAAFLLFAPADASSAGAVAAPSSLQQEWTSRLEALQPEQPMAYFLLAEEIADSATDLRGRSLARELFRLSGALDPDRLGRSSALALADLADDALEKRTFLALATLLDRRSVLPSSGDRIDIDVRIDPARALAFANALSYYRRGRGERTLQLLRDHDLEPLLRRFVAELGDPDRILEDARRYQRGDRLPTVDNVLTQIRLEAALLSGANRSWSSDLLVSGDDPLVEVNPDHADGAFETDSTRPYYRNGRWVSRP